jgi:NADH dehydrogenase
MATASKRPKVVVVGAGFGGLSVLKTLGNKAVDVLLVDRNNYHGFWPLLYQVATGALDSASIAYPVRGIIRPYKNADFQLSNVKGFDYEKKQVLVENGQPIDYDYLVVAAGSAQFYFGNDVLAEKTFSMKDVDEAEQIRNHVITCFEKAQVEPDPTKRKALMTVAIVGGGPTGVELAGGFAELFKIDYKKDFPNLNMDDARIVMIEAMGNILLPFSNTPDLQKATAEELGKRGVDIMLSKPVKAVENNVVEFNDGDTLAAGTVIWAAGVRGAHLASDMNVDLQRGFRVPVTETLNLEAHKDVFVIGDMAYLDGFKWGDKTMAYPMLAQVAIQMGQQAANNILVLASGGNPSKFTYKDKGSMAIIGRNAAIVSAAKPIKIKMGQNGITKFPGWVMWLAVHVMFLFGWRNRLVSIFNWIWNWFFKDRGARVLTGQRDPKTESLNS